MNYLYYPGCSLKSTGKGYEESLLAVLDALEVPHIELADWNCCGATSYMAIDEKKAFALAARNLALAEEQSSDDQPQLLAPCAACYLVLTKTQHALAESPQLGGQIQDALGAAGMTYRGRVQVRHPLDVLTNDIGLETLKTRRKVELRDIKVACYYGCQIVRPYATFDDQYNPVTMDNLVAALGAEPVEWPLKTRCCSGTLTGTIEDIGLRLNYILLREAKKRGADVIATACPLCQFNLECYQDKIVRQYQEDVSIPVVYFTQLIGLALGSTRQHLGLERLFVPFKSPATV